MKWDMVNFLNGVEDITGGNRKFLTTEYSINGTFPIIDQGENVIGGYTESNDIVKREKPVVVFGDHTKALKYIDFDFCMGADGVKILQPHDTIDTKFLYYYLQTIQLPNVGYSRHFKFLKDIQIPLPPLAEQKRIAAILDKADTLRRKDEELLKKYDETLDSIFNLFYKSITENANYYYLNDIATEEKNSFCNGPFGSDLLTSELKKEGVPVIYIRDIRNGSFIWKSNVYVTEKKAFQLKSCAVKSGDILIAKVGDPPGISAVYPFGSQDAIITQDVIRIRPNTDIIKSEYLQYLLNSSFGKFLIKPIIIQGTRCRFALNNFKKLKVLVPSIQKQNYFIKITNNIENQKKLIQNESKELFQSLLQQAFKGEL